MASRKKGGDALPSSSSASASAAQAGQVVNPSGENSRPARTRAPSAAPTGEARFGQEAGVTQADVVYRKLHADIAGMVLRPGTPISEQAVAAEFGVSRTPVREAILRLVKEKLVEIVPKSGSFVGRIPVSTLMEAILARRALELVMVEKACARITGSQLLAFRASLERQREIAASGDLAVFHGEDEAFHARFAEIAGYDGIWDLIRQLKLQVDRYRQLTLPQAGRMDMIIEEHTAIIDAIDAGDTQAAMQAMGQHLDKLKLDFNVFEKMWPAYFIMDWSLDCP